MLVTQSCPTLCDPIDCIPPGSSVHGILQARILEWVAMPFSRVSSQPRDQTQVSHIADIFVTIWATRGNPEALRQGSASSSHGPILCSLQVKNVFYIVNGGRKYQKKNNISWCMKNMWNSLGCVLGTLTISFTDELIELLCLITAYGTIYK